MKWTLIESFNMVISIYLMNLYFKGSTPNILSVQQWPRTPTLGSTNSELEATPGPTMSTSWIDSTICIGFWSKHAYMRYYSDALGCRVDQPLVGIHDVILISVNAEYLTVHLGTWTLFSFAHLENGLLTVNPDIIDATLAKICIQSENHHGNTNIYTSCRPKGQRCNHSLYRNARKSSPSSIKA
jgi:hypothetical protein